VEKQHQNNSWTLQVQPTKRTSVPETDASYTSAAEIGKPEGNKVVLILLLLEWQPISVF